MMGYAGTTPERAQETLDVMVRELHYLHGTITEEELTRARANMLSALVISEESSSSRAASNASDYWHMNRVRELAEIKDAINQVTSAAVYQCLDRYSYHELSLLTLGSKELVFEREI
jgi:predicted Zn-dependent peptidase